MWSSTMPSARVRGPFVEVDRDKVRDALMVTAYGAFLVAQAAAKRMVPKESGAILSHRAPRRG